MRLETVLAIATAPKRDSRHWKQREITWGEVLEWMKSPSNVKACGNYVLGTINASTVRHRPADDPCTDLHRTKTSISSRGAITLDVDTPEADFIVHAMGVLEGTAAVIHTTYSSSPSEPRYRVIVPLDREVKPDEYHTAAAALMQQLGEEQMDQGSVQPERYMFRPSEKKPGFFQHWILDGDPASADQLLHEFREDLSALPAPKPSHRKRDPFALEGTIGAFNRAYEDFGDLIREYDLPYELVEADRWQLAGAAAAAGMGVIAPGLVFSHHANDPAFGSACSAFDLARVHLYGHLDDNSAPGTPVNRLPSNAAMMETATGDLRVVRELVGEDFSTELAETSEEVTGGNWRLDFRIDAKTGKPKDDIFNWDLISRNDPAFRGLYYNELSLAIETDGELPWRAVEEGSEVFDSGDRASLALYIEREYNIRPSRAYLDDMILDVARSRRVNPVRDYLETLKWDGAPRVETCLPGVEPTVYTRMVARKAMVAAVARMMDPGCKWDHTLVLFGSEGLGKSYWVDTMAKGYSAELGKLSDKDTLITMQRSWIMTSDEGHSLKKTDFDAQKAFLTRTADVFRMPYDREARVHKRHSVIWGTTNDEVFLRRQEGNRRFLIVHSRHKVDFDLLTPEYVDQVWAEALHLYRAGELLYLTPEESIMASRARERFTEEDALTGIIEEYLETLVPSDWAHRSPESRQLWLMDKSDGFEKGTEQITEICSLQIWVEAMGRRRGEHRRVDLLEINDALSTIEGWAVRPGRRRVPGYGPQKVFYRVASEDGSDLI